MRTLYFLLLYFITFSLMGSDRSLPKGIYAATLTPLHADLTCNGDELARHCFDLVERGCRGIALFGTTGEGPSFSVNERKEALEKLIQKGFDPKKIILGNGSSGITDTVDLAREALKHGCAALLIAPPSFFKNVSDEGVIAFYREIIQRVNNSHLRVILYHIPQFSGVPISLKVIEVLRQEFPHIIIGLKESEGNLSLTKAVLNRFPDFQVFVGNEKQIIEAVYEGASGSICGVANLYPELICSLYEQGKKSKTPNPPELDAVFEALQGYPFIPAAKALMEKRRGNWRWTRPPLVPLKIESLSSFFPNDSFLPN